MNMHLRMVGLIFLTSCNVGTELEAPTESEPADTDTVPNGFRVGCDTWQDTGYVSGNAYPISVMTIDGKPVELATASSYVHMQAAAANDGVGLWIVSGFRTWEQQAYLYDLYLSGQGNLAAPPGYSNHQSGHALDLNTGAPGVYDWLEARAWEFGFERTVPSEDWHWEYWGDVRPGLCMPMTLPTQPSACGSIKPDEGLAPDTEVRSCDGRFSLAMQGDGNLVLYQDGVGAIWATHTNGRGGHSLWMQSDGNLVLYSAWSTPLFSTESAGSAGAELAIQDDGNVVLYAADGGVLWATNTAGR